MGQETSRFVETARTAAKKLTADFGGDSDGTQLVLWEGVPDDVRWLVISHVKLLLTNDPEALCFRPDQLEPTDSPDHELDDHEAAAAAAALRDRGLGPLIQKAIDTLVPGSISEATFWEHFFCHVDVLKVKIVSDYLRAQELCADARKRKQEEWLSAFDRCDESLQMDLKRAADAWPSLRGHLGCLRLSWTALSFGLRGPVVRTARPGGKATFFGRRLSAVHPRGSAVRLRAVPTGRARS